MTHASLFSGIGGFDLAAEWMGWTNVFQVEIDKFCNQVLAKNFPHVKRYGDIKQFNGTEYRGTIDVLTGGFPCQPFSVAGKRAGTDDNRYLWPEMLRVIREIKPTWIVAENVRGLLAIQDGMVFEQACTDLENEGYEVQPFIIPACAVNAPHKRERVWIIAHCHDNGSHGSQDRQSHSQGNYCDQTRKESVEQFAGCDVSDARDANIKRLEGHGEDGECTNQRTTRQTDWQRNWADVATEFCGMAHGVSDRIHRIKALGNSIVPQVAFEIFNSIQP